MRAIRYRLREVFRKTTYREVSERTGIHSASVSRYCSSDIPSLPFILRVCEEWNINADWLLFGHEPMYRTPQPEIHTRPVELPDRSVSRQRARPIKRQTKNQVD